MSSTAQPARPPVKRSAHMTGVANASVSWNFSMESQEKGPFWRICLLGIPGIAGIAPALCVHGKS